MNYHVFSRTNKGDDLLYIGGVEAPNDRLARVYAYEMYDEEDWDLLAVVREEDFVIVDMEDAGATPGRVA